MKIEKALQIDFPLNKKHIGIKTAKIFYLKNKNKKIQKPTQYSNEETLKGIVFDIYIHLSIFKISRFMVFK